MIGRRADGALPVASVPPPRRVRRSGDPADLVPVHQRTTDQRVIAPDRNGVLRWQGDRDPVPGPDLWQRAGNAIGQYVFRVPDDGSPLCIGAAIPRPGGWGQLRKVVKVTPDMVGKYMHFSTLIAARDAAKIRFWLVTGSMSDRLNGRPAVERLHAMVAMNGMARPASAAAAEQAARCRRPFTQTQPFPFYAGA